jgi:Bifunctional DNA primase/polymerase, N-terminal/Primase C terminal 1 (PriCT-1)
VNDSQLGKIAQLKSLAGRRKCRSANYRKNWPMLLRTALALAERGLAVFPCLPRAKEPATPRGCLDASKDRHMIAHWWGTNPTYNVAIATGDISGIFVTDIDSVDAELELRQLEAEHGRLPATVEALSGRGRHLYFNMPSTPVRNSASKVAPGIDIRGTGGYILSPPSIHPSGRAYTWSVDTASAFADAPDWLLAKIAERTSGNGEATPPAEWRELVAGGVAEGARDCTVAKLSGHLLRRFVDPHVVLELAQCWNATRCRPPLPEDDITRIVNSICAKELRRRGHAG